MRELKYNTETTETINLFIDKDDGVTLEPVVGDPDNNLAGVDTAYITKSDGTEVNVITRVWVASTNVSGQFRITFLNTDVNVYGNGSLPLLGLGY